MRPTMLAAAGTTMVLGAFALAQTTRPAAPQTQPSAAAPAATQPATQAAAGPATLPATTQSAVGLPTPESLLPRLGSDSWKERQAASQELVRLGEDGRPLIRQLLDQPALDVETRTRLEGALAQIDENRLIGPSYITLHLKDASVKTIFDELSRQCYVTLKPFPENLLDQPDMAKVSIDVDHQPFWTAMNQISEKTGIDLQPYNDGVRLMRGGFRLNSAYSCVQGPFYIVGSQITRMQMVMLANGGAANSDFSAQLMAYAEPKLHVLSVGTVVKMDEAIDDAGNSLISADNNQSYFGGAGGFWSLLVHLKYPDHPGAKISRFRGNATFRVQTASERIEIPDVKNLHEVSRDVAGAAVVFHELKKVGQTWELRLSANPQALGPNPWMEFNQSVQTRLAVVDEQAQPLEHAGMRTRGDNNGMEITLIFSPSIRPGDGRASTEPAKLNWEVPTASKDVHVAFTLKDLPMPR